MTQRLRLLWNAQDLLYALNQTMSVNSVERTASVPIFEKRGMATRFLVDAATALTAAITVSPIVAAVDK
jgi:hypothetical protein